MLRRVGSLLFWSFILVSSLLLFPVALLMFPEGTRSVDGQLREFKHGAFTLAQRTGASLLPIVVHGTADALPKRGFVLQGRHAIRIRVLDEIPHRSFAGKPVEVVMQEV